MLKIESQPLTVSKKQSSEIDRNLLVDQSTTTSRLQLVNRYSHDVCMHEVFNASCRQGAVILMVLAVYGRMRIGRCINGDFNIGCSKDVLSYFDAQCSTRQSCDVSIRNLVEIHPCQRDFTSYLQASYKCIEVAGVGLPVCPRDGKVIVSGSSGYVSNGVGLYRTLIGSEACPWMLKVNPGQRMTLRLIVLYSSFATWKTEDSTAFICSSTFVLQERDSEVKKYGVCAGKSRERHLYTSSGNEITLYISRDQMNQDEQLLQTTDRDHPKFVISYEAIGCSDLTVPSNAWMKKVGDNVMIKCNDTMETWYFTCQRNQWIGDWGNCTHRVDLLKNDELREDIFTTHGVVVAVLIGIVLGIFIGIFLLFIVLCSRRRSKQMQKRRSSMFASSRGREYKETLTSFRRGLRSRDERYPALLTGRDQSCEKAEKMYEFGSDYISSSCRGGGAGYLGNGGGYPVALTMTDYGLTAVAASAAEESSSLRDGQQMELVSCHQGYEGPTRVAMDNVGGNDGRGGGGGGATTLTTTTTYARIQPCPQCVLRQCQCLLGTYVKRDCDAKNPSGGTVVEAPPFGSMLFLQQQQPTPQKPRLTAVDATKACVISLFQSDTEDGGLHSTNRLNPADLPDLHPLSSGCSPSPAADPAERLASLEKYDDDDDDDNDAKSLNQPQQH